MKLKLSTHSEGLHPYNYILSAIINHATYSYPAWGLLRKASAFHPDSRCLIKFLLRQRIRTPSLTALTKTGQVPSFSCWLSYEMWIHALWEAMQVKNPWYTHGGMQDGRAALRRDPERRRQCEEKRTGEQNSKQRMRNHCREMEQHNPFTAVRKQQHNRKQGLIVIFCTDLCALPCWGARSSPKCKQLKSKEWFFIYHTHWLLH